MPVKCDICGVESGIDEAFRKIRKSFRIARTTYCPLCLTKRQVSRLRLFLFLAFMAAPLGLMVVWLSPDSRTGWLLLNWFLLEVFNILAIVAHELGHACAARLLGFHVFKVVIGHLGRTIYERSIGGIVWQVKSIPIGGWTFTASKDREWLRVKKFLVVLSGPLTNIVLLVAAAVMIEPLRLWNLGLEKGLRPLELVVVANAFVLAVNLWPRKLRTLYGETPTDGLALVKVPFLKQSGVDDLLAAYYVLGGMEARQQEEFQAARKWFAEGLERFPRNTTLLNNLAITFLDLGDFDTARQHLLSLLKDDHLQPAVRYLVLNNLAWTNLLIGNSALLDEADSCSREAFENVPWLPPVKGTRGSVLVELGHPEQGLPLLRSALEESDNAADKAFNACYIALEEIRKGDSSKGRRYLDLARSLDSDCPLIQRVEVSLSCCPRT